MNCDVVGNVTPSSVTVLVCVRDGAAYLAEAVRSAFDQTEPPLEVLVIDDGSTDSSADIAEAAGARVVRCPALGLGAARNGGFQHAMGVLVLVLDADDVLQPDSLATLRAALQATPTAIGCSGRRVEFVSPELLLHPMMASQGVNSAARRSVILSGGMWRREAGRELPFDTEIATPDLDWINQQRERRALIIETPSTIFRRRIHLNNMTRRPEVKAGYLAVARAAIARRRVELP